MGCSRKGRDQGQQQRPGMSIEMSMSTHRVLLIFTDSRRLGLPGCIGFAADDQSALICQVIGR